MVSKKNCLIIGEHVGIVIVTQYITIATVCSVKTPFISALGVYNSNIAQ